MRETVNIKIRNDDYASEVENALGSKARLRILRLLAKYPDHAFTQYRICQVTGLKRQTASKHMKKLIEMNLIAQRGSSIVRYSFNTNNDRANVLREFFSKMLLM
jgi:DNA-binding MarR family transcriptional regulator